MKRVLLGVFLGLVYMTNASSLLAEDKQAATIEETYQKYIKALQNRDISALFETLSATGVDFVTARGTLLTSLDEYRDYHREWFKADNWHIDFEVKKKEEWSTCAYMLVEWTYREQIEAGPEQKARGMTAFLFIQEDGAWKLKLDTVTPIREPQN